MKKVGILTFHRAWNYGACLQAFATIKIFEKLGYCAELIDYVNEFEQSSKGNQSLMEIGILRWSISMMKNLLWHKDKCVKLSFESGNGLYAPGNGMLLEKKDIDLECFDVLVAGSDQIWNPEITGGLDSAFFLAHGKATKRIAVGPSIGSYVFNESEQEQIKLFLEKFDAIGVRGKHAKKELEKITDQTIRNIPDPTLLLEHSDWEKRISAEKCPASPYLLTYFVGKNYGQYISKVVKYVEKIGLPVYNIQFNTHQFANVNGIVGATPVELLGLIKNAAFVITDSFHGTVFSTVFQRPFIAIENVNNPKRVKEFLHSIGLENRIEPELDAIKQEIDYSSVNAIISNRRKETINWIMESIEDDTE